MRYPTRLMALAIIIPLVTSCTDNLTTALSSDAPQQPQERSNATAAATEPPLVYSVENTGASYPAPTFPPFANLPYTARLRDPFVSLSGGARDVSLANWSRRRSEISASIQKYEIGPKPSPSDVTVTASYSGGNVVVVVTRKSNQRSLRITSKVVLPAGSGPFPAVIGMAQSQGAGTGSLPSSIFTSRNIAAVNYVHNDVTKYSGGQQVSHSGDPYFFLYPEYTVPGNVGQYSAWSWGVSRLIDGLQLLSNAGTLRVDMKHLAVTGCSYAGKMALFAGALDERVALTIAQESGGGGAPSWRVSNDIEPAGTVEKIDNTDGSWFKQDMKTQFAGDNVHKLPHDHHELLALVAPRALLVTGNTDYTWLSNKSNYISSRAAQEVYKTFGIDNRFGFYIDGGHGHCAVPSAQVPIISSFVDKFMLGRTVTTDVHTHPFGTLDYQSWIPWASAH